MPLRLQLRQGGMANPESALRQVEQTEKTGVEGAEQPMSITDSEITKLKKMVTAAQEEFDMAVAYHEVWKPAAYDRTSIAGWGSPMPRKPSWSCGWLSEERWCSR